MDYRVRDSETGEIDYVPLSTQCQTITYDEETGEPHNETFKVRYFKTKFNIPTQYIKIPQKESYKKRIFKYCKETYTLTSKNKVINLKEEIILGYNKTSHRMFLIPSLLFFTKITAVFISIVEILLHIWAHRKNSKNTNPSIYYRSPLHILTAQFCAICRAETEYNNINKIHQDRSKRLQIHLKHMTSLG